jgi:hypothetical protein
MAVVYDRPPGAHRCYRQEQGEVCECHYDRRLSDRACYCCVNSGRLEIQTAIEQIAEDWSRRHGIE